MPFCRIAAGLLCLVFFLSFIPRSPAQVSKGNQILIDRGFQVQGLVTRNDNFHLNTFSNANYTAIMWLWESEPPLMGPEPGFPWGRWIIDEANMPPQDSEAGYLSQLVSLQLGDEWALNDDALRQRAVDWFAAIRNNWPNTILYMNNYGGQVGDAQLWDFIVRAQPDMIAFDSYPWRSTYDPNPTNHIPLGGPPTGWYSQLRIYRDLSRGANIPFASYVQTFHAVQDYDSTVYRDPSASELRLNHFAALAFNAKTLIDFTYNTGASSLFTAPGGDSFPNALYGEKANAALFCRNFGKALVQLKPIDEATSQWTTSVLFLRGRNSVGTLNSIPINFVPDAQDASISDWELDRNDPYLRSWSVTNQGTRNNGQPGDVIVAWFKPLDESFDGPDYTNELYLMVVNGLSDVSGAAADCLQQIKLNFVSSCAAVEMLNPATGLAQAQALPMFNTNRQLVLNLNGGDAVLFKFSDGAPFVGTELIGPPVFATQPLSRTNIAGTDATFWARAAGAAPVSYQWRFNGTNIPGATATNYTRVNAQFVHAGNYTVVASNVSGMATSTVAALTIYAVPEIMAQPESRTVNAGSNVLFTITASGVPAPTYQWRFNGTPIPGTTASSYIRANAQSADAGNYSVVVSNAVGSVTSSNAQLTVLGPPSILAHPQSQAVVAGTLAAFSVNAVGTGPLNYQWRKDGANLVEGGNISGATTAALSVSNVSQGETGLYTVTVSNAYGGVISEPAMLAIASMPVIQTQPQSRTNIGGTVATFSVVATGNGLTYQWRRGGTNMVNAGHISGVQTPGLTLSNVSRADGTAYSVVVSNAAGSVTSDAATLTVFFPLPWREPFNYSVGALLTGQISPHGLPWNDVGTSTAGPSIAVEMGNLEVTNLAGGIGNSIRFGGLGKSARLSFPNPFTSGTVYFSLVFRVLDLTGASPVGGFIAGFNNSTGAQANQPTVVGTRIYLRSTTNGFNLGVAKNTSTDTDWVWNGEAFNTNQTIVLVGSYTFTTAGNSTDDVSKLWINPSQSSFGAAVAPAATLTASSGADITANQIASFVLFQRSTTVEPLAMLADELRIGTNWASVTPISLGQAATLSIQIQAGTPQLTLAGTPGARYQVEYAPAIPASNWTTLTNLLLPSSPFIFQDTSGNGVRFYRAVAIP